MADQRQKKKQRKKSNLVVDFLKKLPEGRKIYYRFGNIMVEVTKDEALKLIKKEDKK